MFARLTDANPPTPFKKGGNRLTVQVDIARLNNPSLQGKEYQQSNRLDENLRIATLMRDGFKCTQCGKKNTDFDAHHIVYREHGGKDTIENLITLCKPCHEKVHKGKLKLDVEGVSVFLDQIAQRTMQGKSYLYQVLGQMAQSPLLKGAGGCSKVFGYQTSAYRKSLSLPKTHDIGALCVATVLNQAVVRDCVFPSGEVIPPIASGLLSLPLSEAKGSSQRNENFYRKPLASVNS